MTFTVKRGQGDDYITEFNGRTHMTTIFIEGDGAEVRFLISGSIAGLIEAKPVGGRITGKITMVDSATLTGR